MSHQEKRQRINEVMEHFMVYEECTVEKAKSLLAPILDDLIFLYEEEYLPLDENYSRGEDTYGYEEERIWGHLYYISDRWGVTFRIRWIIDLLKPDYFPYENDLKN